MDFHAMSSTGDAHTLHLTWGESRGLRRLTQLAYRSGARSIVVIPDGANCKEWAEELASLFDDISDYLTGDPSLLLFVRGVVKDEKGLRDAVSKKRILGYAIVRPSPLGSIAEGFIAAGSSSAVHHITCKSRISVALPKSDKPLTVSLEGVPFMQQDGIVSRCADASLWIATSLVTGAYPDWTGCEIITHERIADAVQYTPGVSSRRLPSGGLNFQDMMLVLERNGYNAIPYVFDTEEKRNRSDHTLYRWIESGMPVILCLALEGSNHTVVVCGHTFDPDAWWPGARTDYFPSLASEDRWLSSSLWAVQYLVIDDNYGPTLAMTRGSLRNRTYAAIVPLPRSARVHLAAEDAETIAANLIFGSAGVLTNVAAGQESQWLIWLKRSIKIPSERFVIRTLLTSSSDLLDHFKQAGYPKSVADQAGKLVLPDSVWLCEVSLPDIYGDKLKVGEIILDPRVPSAFHRTGTESIMWANLAGQAWTPPTTVNYAKLADPVQLFAR